MKPRTPLKPLMGITNMVSINLLRLRRRVAQIAPAIAARMTKPQHGHLRRAAIKAKTGGHCKG